MTEIYEHLHDREQTCESMKQGFQQDCVKPQMILTDPIYGDLRQDPRFKELVGARMKS
jgi:hypothetical protein